MNRPPSASQVRPTAPEQDNRVIEETATTLRKKCEHKWEIVGVMTMPTAAGGPPDLAVIRACFVCSSYTYHECAFVGFREDSLEDKIVANLKGGGGAPPTQSQASENGNGNGVSEGVNASGPPCQHCGARNWRYSEQYEDIRVCLDCEKPQLYRKPPAKRPI
jgi:hypothetical protein